jgi:hypothetical protein
MPVHKLTRAGLNVITAALDWQDRRADTLTGRAGSASSEALFAAITRLDGTLAAYRRAEHVAVNGDAEPTTTGYTWTDEHEAAAEATDLPEEGRPLTRHWLASYRALAMEWADADGLIPPEREADLRLALANAVLPLLDEIDRARGVA